MVKPLEKVQVRPEHQQLLDGLYKPEYDDLLDFVSQADPATESAENDFRRSRLIT
jgi:hypothetical protein